MTDQTDTKTFQYGGVEITIVARPKTKHREALRRVYRKTALARPSLSASTCQEFAAIVAYTVSVKGDVWKPPSPNDDEETLGMALDTWLEEVDEALTELWVDEIEKK